MRRALLSVAVGVSILLGAGQLPAGQNGPNGVSVEYWQYGVPVAQVAAGADFEIRGSGFRSTLPVWVCISTDVCVLSEIDSWGSFTQHRTLQAPGGYVMTIKQARNRQLDTWVVRATVEITVRS